MESVSVSDKTFEQQKAEFFEIIQKLKGSDLDKSEIQKARMMIINNPHVWEIAVGFPHNLLIDFLNKVYPNSNNLIYEAEALSIKSRLGYSSSSQLEKLIIDQIMLCWIGLYCMEHRVFSMVTGKHNLQHGEYWQNVLANCQRRYLRAIESLARIRKLGNGVAFQVNIATAGGQQVNVNELASKV